MIKILVVMIVGIFVLLVGWYLASPLFIDRVVNEDLPVSSENKFINDSNDESEYIEIDNMNEGGIENLYRGDFVDADSFHKTSGKAIVFEQNGKRYLRLEDFKATNGPDLFVYLSKDLGAKEYIDLGELKGNIGNQNYEIPSEVNFEEFDKALIWCKQFSVLFGSAQLN